jgi:hypothetical protein
MCASEAVTSVRAWTRFKEATPPKPRGLTVSYLGSLRLRPTRNNQRLGIRFAADYSFENWIAGLYESSGDTPPATRDHLRHARPQGQP